MHAWLIFYDVHYRALLYYMHYRAYCLLPHFSCGCLWRAHSCSAVHSIIAIPSFLRKFDLMLAEFKSNSNFLTVFSFFCCVFCVCLLWQFAIIILVKIHICGYCIGYIFVIICIWLFRYVRMRMFVSYAGNKFVVRCVFFVVVSVCFLSCVGKKNRVRYFNAFFYVWMFLLCKIVFNLKCLFSLALFVCFVLCIFGLCIIGINAYLWLLKKMWIFR